MSDSQNKPPQGSSEQTHQYLAQLIELINSDKLKALPTDLSKFDPTNLQNHYRLELRDYMVEVSHAKNPDSGKDSYVLLFNNMKNIREGCNEKVILGYLHLDQTQYSQLEKAITTQDLRLKRQAEEKAFVENMQPINQILDQMKSEVQIKPDEISESVDQQVSEPETPKNGDTNTRVPSDSQPTISSLAQQHPKPEIPPAYS